MGTARIKARKCKTDGESVAEDEKKKSSEMRKPFETNYLKVFLKIL